MAEISEIVEGITKAIELEKQAREFYSSKAEKADNKILKDSFEFLAKQEQGHFDALTKLKENMQKTGGWPEQIPEESQTIPTLEQFTGKEKGHFEKMKSNDEISIMLWAMRAERRAENLYRELAEKSSNGQAKEFFEKLAGYEVGHYRLLDSMVETLTDPSDYLQN